MITHFIRIAFELFIGFICLLISVRVIGRRQIQQLTPFDFVSAVVLGEMVGTIIYDKETNWYYMVFGIFIWTLFSIGVEKFNNHSLKARSVISGVPTLIINNGKIDFDVMKKEKIDFTELMSLLRQKDVFAVQEVKYAFVENSGALSVLKKSKHDQVKRQDLQLNSIKNNLNLAVIYDGEILFENLKLLNITDAWLLNKLKQEGIEDVSDVLYAEYDQDIFYVQKYTEKSNLHQTTKSDESEVNPSTAKTIIIEKKSIPQNQQKKPKKKK